MRMQNSFPEPSPPRRSHAVGTGLDEPTVPHAITQQTEQKENFPLYAEVVGFLHVNCTSPGQEGTISLQANVGVKPETTTTTAQVVAREEFARPSKNR